MNGPNETQAVPLYTGGDSLLPCGALFDDAPLGVAFVTAALRLGRVNPALAALCGRAPEDLLGRACCEVCGREEAGREADRGQCAMCPICECLGTGEVQHFEGGLGDRTVRYVVSPARRSSPASGVLVMVADVTVERTLQRQLIHAQRLASIGQMTAGVAHEIKNPLTTVEGFAQLLRRRKELSEDAAAYIERLLGEAQRCTRIVSRLLKFSRLKGDAKSLLDLNATLRDTMDLMRYQLVTNGVQVREEYHPAPLLVLGERLGLQQVAQNAVSNASDAMGRMGRQGILTVRTRRENGRALVEFENDGPPIEDPTRLFQPFHTTKKPGEGTGLGLYVSRAIVQQHQGAMEIMNVAGGVLVRVALPLSEGALEAQEAPSGSEPCGQGSSRYLLTPPSASAST